MAARFWVAGGNGNWSSTTNWSATSGGGSGASVPGSADTATFNASSGAGTATVDSNVTIQTLTMTGFTGTLAFGVNTISVNSTGTVYTGGATFAVTGTPVIIVTNATATATTVIAGAVTEANAISFKFTGGTYQLTFLATASHAARNVDFTGYSGTWLDRTNAYTIYGSLTISTGMNSGSAGSTGILTFGGTSGTQVFTSNTSTVRDINFPITINGVGGTVQLADSLRISKNIILTNGTFDANNVGIALTGSGTFSMTTGSVFVKGVTTTGAFALAFTQTSGTLTQIGNNTFRAFTLTSGTLNLGSYKLTCETFASSNANARTIAFGTGNVTCTLSGTAWTTATTTNLSVTGTSNVNITYSGVVGVSVLPGICTEAQAISFNFTAGTYALTFLGTVNYSAKNVNFTGFTGTWNARTVASVIYGSLTLSSGMTFTASSGVLTFGATSGTQIITTNGKTVDEPLAVNGVGGTVQLADALTLSGRAINIITGTFDGNSKTISGGTSITMSTGPATIKGLSTTMIFTHTSGTLTQGADNSVGSYTFTAGTLNLASYKLTVTVFGSSNINARTIDFGTGNITCDNVAGGTLWSTSTATGLTVTGTPTVNITNSGAVATTVIPGPLTEAQAISFNFTNGTYALAFLTVSTHAAKSVNFTGFAGTWNATQVTTIYGNLTLSTGMTLTASVNGMTFGATSGTQVITSNAKTIDFALTVDGVGGTVRLADALLMGTTRLFAHTAGTIDLNGKTLTVGTAYQTAGAATKILTFNGGTLVCPAATTTAFNNASPGAFSTVAGTGTGKISMTAATAKSFVGAAGTFNCTLSNDGAGALTITGSNTFTTIANGVQPTQFTFQNTSTTTVTNWNVSGISGSLVTIICSFAGGVATLSKASGTVSSNYLSLKDSTATGGATWYAGANSVNVSGNSGWIFSNAPANAAGSFFFMF